MKMTGSLKIKSQNSVIACDLGGTKLSAAVVDSRLRHHSTLYKEIAHLSYDDVIQTLLDTVAEMVSKHPEVEAVGVAVAGQVDERTGTISHRAIKRGETEADIASLQVHKYRLADMLLERAGLPAFIENDGNSALLAEWRAGVAQGKDNVVCLAIGTYLGSGVVSRGQIVRRRTSGPLLGGTLLQSPTNLNELQYIGVLVGGHAVEELATRLYKQSVSSTKATRESSSLIEAAVVAEAARAGDLDAQNIFRIVGSSFHIAVVNAINEYDPEMVVLTGGLMGASDLLFSGLSEFIEQWRLPGADSKRPDIVLAKFGSDAGKLGAAIWAFDNLGISIEASKGP